jgi:hypothetical protein
LLLGNPDPTRTEKVHLQIPHSAAHSSTKRAWLFLKAPRALPWDFARAALR